EPVRIRTSSSREDSPRYNLFMATLTGLTVEEFYKLPDDRGPVYYELRHGEIVAVPRAKLKHHIIQGRLRDRLKAVAPAGAFVESEVAYRALPEYELRVADVAIVTPERFAQADPEDNLH